MARGGDRRGILQIFERHTLLARPVDRVKDACLEPSEQRLRSHESVRNGVDVNVVSRG